MNVVVMLLSSFCCAVCRYWALLAGIYGSFPVYLVTFNMTQRFAASWIVH